MQKRDGWKLKMSVGITWSGVFYLLSCLVPPFLLLDSISRSLTLFFSPNLTGSAEN